MIAPESVVASRADEPSEAESASVSPSSGDVAAPMVSSTERVAPVAASSSGTVSDVDADRGTVSSGLEKSCGAPLSICCETVEVVVRSTFCSSESEVSKASTRRGSAPGSTTVVVVGVTAMVTSLEDAACSGAGSVSVSVLEHPATRATAQQAASKPERTVPERTVRLRSVDFTGTRLLTPPAVIGGARHG
ncbi:hypothetical protein [Rhodococcus sp. BS-15]|uniref:hypothetical protein n=1 Tax=Rhodococcus sp. BS-15 TaxID=1304954 RepID=UPI001F2D8460|nr:hypothetical protein [Rhodococcus sp. BS-15]